MPVVLYLGHGDLRPELEDVTFFVDGPRIALILGTTSQGVSSSRLKRGAVACTVNPNGSAAANPVTEKVPPVSNRTSPAPPVGKVPSATPPH